MILISVYKTRLNASGREPDGSYTGLGRFELPTHGFPPIRKKRPKAGLSFSKEAKSPLLYQAELQAHKKQYGFI
jgi:hypothetical protein